MSHKNFHITVKGVIVKDNKALVLKELDIRDHVTPLYDLPGGRIEGEEAIEDSLTRELKEEINVTDFKIGPIIHAQRHPYLKIKNTGRMILYYKVDVKNPKIKLSKEHISFEWISKKDLASIVKNKEKMHTGMIKALEKVLK